jgi:hypothetical protein
MRIDVKLSDNGQLYLKVYSEDTTELTTRISSYNTNKVEQPIVNEVHNLVMEVGRYNGLSDTEIVKHFVENTLTEKEIRELIKSLEN